MKTAVDSTTEQPRLQRRKLLGAMGTTGALVAAAGVLATRRDAAEPLVEATAQQEAEHGKGYRLSEHVQRYYQTTKV